MLETETRTCEGWDGEGGYEAPPEACEEDALPGLRFCVKHVPAYNWEDEEED